MSNDGNKNPRGDARLNYRFMRYRGRGSWKRKRPYYFQTVNVGNCSKTNTPRVFPQVAGGQSSESLQRNEFFTAPQCSGEEKIQVIPILNPVQYSGWRLYFPTEIFLETSPLVSHIKAFEKHIQKYPAVYDLSDIHKKQWFNISPAVLSRDNEFCLSWRNFNEELQLNPYIVLSCLGLGMHSVITNVVFGSSAVKDTECTIKEYRSRQFAVPKISARPVDFLSVSSIADITSECLDKMFAVHGRVSSITNEETKCTWVTYKCKRCRHEQAIRQTDYSTKILRCRIQCNCKGNLIESRSSIYTKIECVQMIQLHELGLQNSYDNLYIDIELRRDLVDQVYPGLEITVMGVLKMKSITKHLEHYKGTKQNCYMQAVSLVEVCPLHSTQKDNEIVQMINMEQNCLRLLVQSFAPEMCGYEMIKFAVLLSLFGGSGSQLQDECEVNVLLVGDPGLGKSDFLKNAVCVSQRGKLISLKEKSNFMPTFQNTSNCIETGSILTSHKGHCCIDDMEKLSQAQEKLIHIMQTKSITLRSYNVLFNVIAKPSIIAATNPAGGHYDSSKLLRENVRLSPSFLSLFHLVFVVYDEADKDRDTNLTEHVKALHSGIKQILSIPSKYDMELKPSDYNSKSEDIELDKQLRLDSDEILDLLPAVLLKKYIEYARHIVKPLLSEAAGRKIKEYYMGLRSEKNEEELFSITTRKLEGLILLAQARARAELCFEVSEEHVQDIIQLTRHSHTSVLDRPKTTLNGSIAGTSRGSEVKKFIQMLQLRANAIGRTNFEYEELKDIATHAGIRFSVTNIINVVNERGYLLKKGSNLYEFISD